MIILKRILKLCILTGYSNFFMIDQFLRKLCISSEKQKKERKETCRRIFYVLFLDHNKIKTKPLPERLLSLPPASPPPKKKSIHT